MMIGGAQASKVQVTSIKTSNIMVAARRARAASCRRQPGDMRFRRAAAGIIDVICGDDASARAAERPGAANVDIG